MIEMLLGADIASYVDVAVQVVGAGVAIGLLIAGHFLEKLYLCAHLILTGPQPHRLYLRIWYVFTGSVLFFPAYFFGVGGAVLGAAVFFGVVAAALPGTAALIDEDTLEDAAENGVDPDEVG